MAQPQAMRGPAMGPGRRGPMGPVPKIENPGKILKRILGYVFKNYGFHCIIVFGCIIALKCRCFKRFGIIKIRLIMS